MPRPKGPPTKRIAPVFFIEEHDAICRSARRAGVCPTEFVKAAAMERVSAALKKAA